MISLGSILLLVCGLGVTVNAQSGSTNYQNTVPAFQTSNNLYQNQPQQTYYQNSQSVPVVPSSSTSNGQYLGNTPFATQTGANTFNGQGSSLYLNQAGVPSSQYIDTAFGGQGNLYQNQGLSPFSAAGSQAGVTYLGPSLSVMPSFLPPAPPAFTPFGVQNSLFYPPPPSFMDRASTVVANNWPLFLGGAALLLAG